MARKDLDYEQIGLRLRTIRERANLTQAELGRVLSVSEATYSRYESGERRIPIPDLRRAARKLGVSMAVLLGEDLLPEPDSPTIAEQARQVAAAATKLTHLLEVQSSTHAHSAGEPTLIPGRPLIRLRIEESSVSAGAGSLAGDDLLYQPEPGREGATHRAFRITGDCMEPEILAGDTVIVDTELAPEAGDVVVAVHDGDFLVKMLDQDETGWLLLAHDDRPAVRPNGETQVIGVVTDVQRRVKRGRRARRQ